jgi:hypothetical protein
MTTDESIETCFFPQVEEFKVMFMNLIIAINVPNFFYNLLFKGSHVSCLCHIEQQAEKKLEIETLVLLLYYPHPSFILYSATHLTTHLLSIQEKS